MSKLSKPFAVIMIDATFYATILAIAVAAVIYLYPMAVRGAVSIAAVR